MSNKTPKPLKSWGAEAQRWFEAVVQSWELQPEDLELLTATASNLNRYWECERVLAAEGLTVWTESGMLRKHPASEISKNSWAAFLAGVRQLKLEDPAEARRPGRPDQGSILAAMNGGIR